MTTALVGGRDRAVAHADGRTPTTFGVTLGVTAGAATSAAKERPVRLAVQGLTKVFADDPKPALALLAEGRTRDEVLARTGVTVGVQGAGFAIRAGEIFVVMGLSGSGKSTLVRLLNRLIEPTEGAVLLDGRDLTAMTRRELIEARRRSMSMVFQSFALMPHLTALDNAAFALTVAGVPKAKRREAATRALEQVGLGAYAERLPRELSGGMQQRVGLARALANDPAILLMDEAFSALDPLIRTEMQDELLRLQRERERTIVFISHDLDEAMRIGDRIAVMESGRIVQIGTPLEILRAPADDYVRSFFKNVDASRVLRAADAAEPDGAVTIHLGEGAIHAALRLLAERGQGLAHVLGEGGRFIGVVRRERLERVAGGGLGLAQALAEDRPSIRADARLHAILGVVADAEGPVAVVDDDGLYRGAVSRSALLHLLNGGR